MTRIKISGKKRPVMNMGRGKGKKQHRKSRVGTERRREEDDEEDE
jgi:hypothetical protein